MLPTLLVLASVAVLPLPAAIPAQDPPALVRSEPAHGAEGVELDVGTLRLFFDRPMKQNGWSLVDSEQGQFPPLATEDSISWEGPTCCQVELASLEPETTYAVQLNSPTRTGFRSAQENVPLPATTVVLRTRKAPTPLRGMARRDPLARGSQPEAEVGDEQDGEQDWKRTAFGDIPGLTVNAPPPDWVRPGLRITYYTIAAVLPSEPYSYSLDEKGRWKDDHGNKFKRNEMEKSGSHGLLQADILSLNEKSVAALMVFFMFDGANTSAPLRKLESGFVANAATCGDLWIHPEVLKELLEESKDLTLTRVSKEIDGTTYDAVQIISNRRQGRGVWVYDLKSGILLYSSDVTVTAGTATKQNTLLSPPSTVVRFNTFKSTRFVDVPWANQPPPPWLRTVRRIDFRGEFKVEQQGYPSGQGMVFNTGLQVIGRGADYLHLKVEAQGGPPGGLDDSQFRVNGNRQLCGLWIPPQGLAQLRPGQVLDRDPLTKLTTSVKAVDGQKVVFELSSPLQEGQLTYRRSDGMLIHAVVRESLGVPGMSNAIELTLTGVG